MENVNPPWFCARHPHGDCTGFVRPFALGLSNPSDSTHGFLTGMTRASECRKKWNGEYLANGTIVMKRTGDYVAFHIIDAKSLKDYLFQNIKLFHYR